MNRRLARVLIRLYPAVWRKRYGAEFEVLLQDERRGWRSSLNVVTAAALEHVTGFGGGTMATESDTFRGVLLHPSALIPMAMSTTALALVLGHILMFGAAREADEGAVAHLWQILMAAQVPVLLFFALKWLPRAFRPALGVLAVQVGAVLAAMAPVFYFNL